MMVLNKSGSICILGLFIKVLNFTKRKESNYNSRIKVFYWFFRNGYIAETSSKRS
jgi:hypothetical protein